MEHSATPPPCFLKSIISLAAILLTACGGGGGSPNINVEGPPLSDIDPNSIQLSDMHLNLQDGSRGRASIFCTPSGFCRATVLGDTFEFQINEADSSRGSGTIYNTLGDWNDTVAVAVYGRIDGESSRYASAVGIVHPNSLPRRGSATWRGDMVGLDANNRVVRGGAELTIPDLSNPFVDVTLTPRARPAMQWENLSVANGRFSQDRRIDDYIKGEIYGQSAQEAGGMFERNGIVGAFGAER